MTLTPLNNSTITERAAQTRKFRLVYDQTSTGPLPSPLTNISIGTATTTTTFTVTDVEDNTYLGKVVSVGSQNGIGVQATTVTTGVTEVVYTGNVNGFVCIDFEILVLDPEYAS